MAEEKIVLELDKKNYPILLKRYGPEGAKAQAISMCLKAGWEITRGNLEGMLTNLEEALEEDDLGGVDDPQ